MQIKDEIRRTLSKISGNGGTYRLEIPVKELSILSWLAHQTQTPKIYWHDRKTDFEVAGIGCADCIHTPEGSDYLNVFALINSRLSSDFSEMRYYGGFAFNNENDHEQYWEKFGNNNFILPRVEVLRRGKNYFIAVNMLESGAEDISFVVREIEQIDETEVSLNEKMPDLEKFEHAPDRDGWAVMIDTALSEIIHNDFKKIVLARRSKLQFSSELNIYQILENLKKLNPDSTHFCIQPVSDEAFIGGTPELLYRRHRNNIHSVAIAGTRKRGITEIEDERLEQDLLQSEKDLREHQFVIDNVLETMQDLCLTVKMSREVGVLKLARVQHLFTSFEGRLKVNVNDVDIISKLHPTPAVGGYPNAEALPEISRLEPFNRGWYAAPVGWVSAEGAHFVVAIRSGLVNKNQLFLYSGAGIVDGSDAESEWEEIDNKLANFLRALQINGEFNHDTVLRRPVGQARSI